ncbi:hypothetical protein SAMN05216374_2338 [Tardiphaga sp. OK246]|jgi:hypothetical protein|uniref:hypothetical protein n=1 Tax=Tardiphaga sp. OK246 TaxID=1855307 RepID=UPI000B62CAB5|nr:hypothetical protein [Tardiphaga sp. OK246]SNT02164.1 hypothetical protein SAMN05216374_2338 [Tardiphaga sp. OK246]
MSEILTVAEKGNAAEAQVDPSDVLKDGKRYERNLENVGSLRKIAPHVIEALEYSAETRSISVLSALLEDVAVYIAKETDAATRHLFSSLIEFAARGREIELLYGKDSLLDLDHPDIRYSIELGIIKQADVGRILATKKTLPPSVSSLRYVGR